MEKVIYSDNNGLGIIMDQNDIEADYIVPKQFHVVDTIIKPGDFTDLFGLFIRPVEFVGALKEDEACMCFKLGQGDRTLFEQLTYYNCFYWISSTRIFIKYAQHSGRDYNWINGKWK